MTDWDRLRAGYPALSRYVYADNAAVGAMPQAAADAAAAAQNEMVQEGMIAYGRLKAGLGEVRSAVASLLGAETEDVGFTDCTSTSMNLVAMMAAQEWQHSQTRRDQLVVLRDEFPSSTLGWLCQGFEPVWVESEADGRYPVDKIIDAIGPRCRAVLTSEVQYKTGVRVDVAGVAGAIPDTDILHVVNATQSAGVVPQAVRERGHSALTVSSVKWLCAGVGTGILYLSEQMRSQCKIPVAGWMSQVDPFAMINDQVLSVPHASAVETGCVELSRLYALDKCAGIVSSIGIENIQKRVLDLTGLLVGGLQDLGATVITPHGDDERAGIVSVRKENAPAWRDWSLGNNLLISLRGADTLRFSLHFFNNEEDVQQLLEAWKTGP